MEYRINNKSFTSKLSFIEYCKSNLIPKIDVYKVLNPNDNKQHYCKFCGAPARIDSNFKMSNFCGNVCAKKYAWENMSPERKLQNREKLISMWKNKSDEEKEKIFNKIGKSNKKIWRGKSKELLKERNLKISKKQKENWVNKSDEEKENWKRICIEKFKNNPQLKENLSIKKKNLWKSKSDEEKENYSNKIRIIRENFSNKKKKDISKKSSESLKKFWGSLTENEKQKISNKRVISFNNNHNEMEKELIKKKRKETWINKLNDANDSFIKKRKELWSKKNLKEMYIISNKRRKNKISFDDFCILNDKNKFKKYLIEFYNKNKKYPSIIDIKNKFMFSQEPTILLYIHRYELEDYISWNKSSPEQEIYDYIKSIYKGEIIRNNRKILKGKELDIYIPEKNLAIEFNGCYWHSIENKIDINYHQNKSKICLENGIKLIHIYEDEWEEYKNNIKNLLKGLIIENNFDENNIKIKNLSKKSYSKIKCDLYGDDIIDKCNKIIGVYNEDKMIAVLGGENKNNKLSIKCILVSDIYSPNIFRNVNKILLKCYHNVCYNILFDKVIFDIEYEFKLLKPKLHKICSDTIKRHNNINKIYNSGYIKFIVKE